MAEPEEKSNNPAYGQYAYEKRARGRKLHYGDSNHCDYDQEPDGVSCKRPDAVSAIRPH